AILKKVQSVVFATRSMDKIVIEYRPNDARAERTPPQEARVTRVEEPSSRRVPSHQGQNRLDKVAWIQWMTQSLDITESTAKRCQTELTRTASFAEANGLFAADLFSNDLTRTKEIVEQIKALPKFKLFNIEGHHRSSAALNYLIQYLESGINGTYAATSQTPTQQDFTGDYFPETPDLPEGARRVDFKNLNIGNGTKLIQAFLFGYLFKVKYWRDLYALAINEIWKQTAMDLHEYANIVRRFTRLTPAGEQNRYPKPQLILDDEYSLDVNYTVVNMLERLRDILDAFNLPFGNVAIDYTYWGTGAQSNDATASEYDVAPTVAPTPVASRLTDSGVPVEEFVNSQRRLDAVREVMRSRYSTGGLRVFGNAFESFKDMYAELTGESVTEDDAKLLLDKVCVYNDDYYYYVSEDMRQELSQTVRDAFAFCGVVYFVPLFNKHFMHESKWNFLTQELMVQLIREQFPLLRYEERFMTNDPERTVSELIHEKLEELFSNEPYQKVDQLATDLPYIPKLTIQTSCSTFQKVVADNKGTYIWLDVLQFDMDEVERTRRNLAQWLQNHEAASVRHIIAERTAELNMVGPLIAQNAIYLKFLSDEYDKSNGLIFHAGAKIKPDNLVKSYCEEIEETVEVDTLEAFREEMAIPKDRFDSNIHEWLFKLSEKLFAPVWMIQFSPQVVQRVDEIIAAFTQNSVIALKDVSSFTSFPYVENLTWNRYSLGSYVYRASKAFKLLTPSQGTSKQDRGVIVSRSNTELAYDDALAHMLLRAGVELTDDAVNEYLVEHGLRLRRGGSQEDLIRRVQNLKAQRENKRE
ncbi:MAG: hypothetical protein Q4G03_12385, partial [Planctomycetia bacterium]|nr:hypothetical protein [Planctomycetia bacterium]